MAIIKKLTKKQRAKFDEYVKRWTGYGTSTEPADRPRAEAAIRMMYHAVGLTPPKQIIWAGSPQSMMLAKNAWGSAGGDVGKSVGLYVRNSVCSSIIESIREGLMNNIADEFCHIIFDRVKFGDDKALLGQNEATWLSFHRFMHDEFGMVKETKHLIGFWELCESCGWILPFENVCFASERHDVCNLDDRGVIHSEDGPAIRYPDGFAIHAWHGVSIPSEWIEDKANLKAVDVLSVKNVEQRMAGCQILGWAKVADQLDRKIIDGDPNTDIGALVELTLPGLPEPGRFLMAQCPRNGTICEGVPRVSDIDGLPIETAIAAQAWRDALPTAEYTHPSYRC